jgi:hypothetical protein
MSSAPDSIERMKSTPLRVLPDDSTRAIQARYGMHWIKGNRAPYFSITGTTYVAEKGKWVEDGGGCIHDQIRTVFPELAHLIRWHLTDQDGTPMHYQANGLYWLNVARGGKRFNERETPEQAFANFKSTVKWGSAPDFDTWQSPNDAPTPGLRERWFTDRLPAVRAAFLADMQAAGIEFIDMPVA